VDGEVFPHVFGPIPTSAVVAWRPARLPPIDLGGPASAPLPPPPTLTVAFRGLALVLASGALVAFGCAVGAQVATDDGRLQVGFSYVLWSLMGVLGAPALVAFAWGEWARRSTSLPD